VLGPTYAQLKRAFVDIDQGMVHYVTAAVCGQLSHICKYSDAIGDHVLDYLAEVAACWSPVPTADSITLSDEVCVASLQKASRSMQCIAVMPWSSLKAVHWRVSGSYMQRITNYQGRLGDSLRAIVNVYLGYQFYRFQLDQMVIDCCATVPTPPDDVTDSCRYVVEGNLLHKSGDVSTVLGLVSLYQFISRSTSCDARHTSQVPMVNYFTTVVFARYLLSLVYALYDEEGVILTELAMEQYATSIRSTKHLNCADVMLFAFRSRSMSQPPDRDVMTETNALDFFASKNIHVPLLYVAEEHLGAHRQLLSRDLSPAYVVTSTDMAAMAHFEIDNFEQCLKVSAANVDMLWSTTTDPLPVVISAPFTSFMDRNIAEILALNIMIGYDVSSRRVDARGVSVSQLTMSMYTMLHSRLRRTDSSTVSSIVDDMRRVKTLNERADLSDYDHLLLTYIYRKAIFFLKTFYQDYVRNGSVAE